MGPLAAGIVLFLGTAFIFWRSLPRNGEKYRFADTAWEPYVGVTLTAGLAIAFALTLTGILGMAA